MDVLAIELNDSGIRAARSSGDGLLAVDGPHRASPGFALMERKTLVTGDAAARQACLHPLDIDNRFWDRLDTQPADPRKPRSPNRAEVAFVHLQRIVAALQPSGEDAVVLAVPPSYEPRQLGLLAGIARELDLPLRGLVATPVALDAAPIGGRFLVVELSLHRSAISMVEAGREIVLGETRVCPDVGLHAFRRQWIRAVGDEFVRNTRFDPLHDAPAEQALHDRLPTLLETVARSGGDRLDLTAGSLDHQVTVTGQMLADAGRGLIFRWCDDIRTMVEAHRPAEILLTHEAAQVPGLQRVLQQQVAVPVRSLEAGAAALGLVRQWPELFDQPEAPGVAHHVRRRAGENAAPASAAPAAVTTSLPTHLLLGDRAHPLPADPLFVDLDRPTGRLEIGGASGVACLRRNGHEIVLEIRGQRPVTVDGQAVDGTVSLGIGSIVAVHGSDQTIKLIALTRGSP